jgi:hypothetical protein
MFFIHKMYLNFLIFAFFQTNKGKAAIFGTLRTYQLERTKKIEKF